MSLKEKAKKEEEKLEKKRQKEIAKIQATQAKNIYRESFAGFGIRDLWENRVFKLALLFGVAFIIVFFVFGFAMFSLRPIFF